MQYTYVESSDLPDAVSCGNPAPDLSLYTHKFNLTRQDGRFATVLANSAALPKDFMDWADSRHGFRVDSAEPFDGAAELERRADAVTDEQKTRLKAEGDVDRMIQTASDKAAVLLSAAREEAAALVAKVKEDVAALMAKANDQADTNIKIATEASAKIVADAKAATDKATAAAVDKVEKAAKTGAKTGG
jgi:vacuolar-type H+-ATPase subunit H